MPPQESKVITIYSSRQSKDSLLPPLVQIRRKLRKIHSEIHIQGKKKTLENAFQILKTRGKKSHWGVRKENFYGG
jgi:hypothetical protein